MTLVFQMKTLHSMISVVRLFFFLILFFSCSKKKSSISENNIFKIQGYTQGTTYNIKYVSNNQKIKKNEIDSLFNIIDLSMSSYIEDSNISLINNNITNKVDTLLLYVLKKSKIICSKTDGSFDVTVAPLVNSYGFGPQKKPVLTDDISLIVGCDKFKINRDLIFKDNSVQIDVNGIAQGYSVDFISKYFSSKEILNYMIEIGGEVYCSGKKNNENWILGISNPLKNPHDYIFKVPLENRALATSGTTRKINLDSNHTHIISPHTYVPIQNNLLSVSVIADNCMDADAYATAFMEMGIKKSLDFLEKNEDNLEVMFVYLDSLSNDMMEFRTDGFIGK